MHSECRVVVVVVAVAVAVAVDDGVAVAVAVGVAVAADDGAAVAVAVAVAVYDFSGFGDYFGGGCGGGDYRHCHWLCRRMLLLIAVNYCTGAIVVAAVAVL